MINKIENQIEESIQLKKIIITRKKLLKQIEKMAELLTKRLRKGNKLLVAGNGGSAADAQHFAAELVGRYKKERKGYPAISLSTDTSFLTAYSNDYDFKEVFARQIEALGSKDDIFVGITTSGNSENVIRGTNKAKEKGLFTIALTGKSGGKMKEISDLTLIVPSQNTPRIQEAHILIIHILCEMIEQKLVKNA
jgi:D-sedoheptulose 7-phosphate isomerase